MRGARMVAAATVFVATAAGAVQAPAAAAAAPVTDPAALVDPFIGTAGGFSMFPGTDVPFGMIQWSPDTDDRKEDAALEPG